jgi:hypothetical protein
MLKLRCSYCNTTFQGKCAEHSLNRHLKNFAYKDTGKRGNHPAEWSQEFKRLGEERKFWKRPESKMDAEEQRALAVAKNQLKSKENESRAKEKIRDAFDKIE